MTATAEGADDGRVVAHGLAERLPYGVTNGGRCTWSSIARARDSNVNVGPRRTAMAHGGAQALPSLMGSLREVDCAAFAGDDEDTVDNDGGIGAHRMNKREERTGLATKRNDQLKTHAESIPGSGALAHAICGRSLQILRRTLPPWGGLNGPLLSNCVSVARYHH